MFLKTIQKKLARQCRKTARLLKEGKLAAPKGGSDANIAFDSKGNPVNAIGLVLSRAGFKFKDCPSQTALNRVLKGRFNFIALESAEYDVFCASVNNPKNVRRAVIKPLIALGEALDKANLRKPYTRKPVLSKPVVEGPIANTTENSVITNTQFVPQPSTNQVQA